MLLVGCSGACRTPVPPSEPASLGPRVRLHDAFTIEHPPTATVKEYGGVEEAVWMIKDRTFEMHVYVNLRPPADGHPGERVQRLIIDGHEFTISRFRAEQPPFPSSYWLEAFSPATLNNPPIFFRANCADAATQDLVEQIIRTLRWRVSANRR